MRNNKWEPVDYMVFIITSVLSISLILTVIKPLFTQNLMNPTSVELLAGVVSSLIAIVSMYVGAKINRKNTDTDK